MRIAYSIDWKPLGKRRFARLKAQKLFVREMCAHYGSTLPLDGGLTH